MNRQIEDLANSTWNASDSNKETFTKWFFEYVGPHLNIVRSLSDERPKDGEQFIALKKVGIARITKATAHVFVDTAVEHGNTHWIPCPEFPDLGIKSKRQQWEEKFQAWEKKYRMEMMPSYGHDAFSELCPPPEDE